MRIGMIAPPWIPVPPPAYGGIESVVDVLAVALREAGHDVLLAASGDSTCAVERLPGFPPADSALLGATLPELRHVALAYPALEDVDVIHDHTLIGPLYRNRPDGIPVAATVHGPFVPEVVDVYREVADDVAIIAISRHQALTARDVRISTVIHHGIDQARVAVGAGQGGYACFLGRMHPDKGVLQAIQVARRAGIPLRIAAKMREAVERDYFTCVIRPQLGADTEFLGELNQEEKYLLLADAIAMVNPIQWDEPFGMVMIESLSAGTPVVATPRGSAPEIVDDGRTGFLRTGIHELGDALLQVDRLDRRECRATAERRFSARRMAAEHVRLYSDLIEGKLPSLSRAS